MPDPRFCYPRVARCLKSGHCQSLFGDGADLGKMLPLLLVSSRAQIVRATSDAVEVERARGYSKVMEADAESSKVHGLNLAFKKCSSMAAGQFKVNVRLDSLERSFPHAGLDPLQPFTDGGMAIGFRILRVLTAEPARLQLNGQAALVGDVVEPVPELVCGHPAESTVCLPDSELLEGRFHVRSASDEIGYLGEEHRLNQQRTGGPCGMEEVAEYDEERFREFLLCSIAAIYRPQLLEAEVAQVCLDFEGAIIDAAGIQMSGQLVLRDREYTPRITSEDTRNFKASHSSAPMKAGKGHPMRGVLQHVSALPRGMGDFPNPVDSFLGQGRANGGQPPDRKQSSTAPALLSVVAEAVSRLSASRFANFAIQRQSEQFADTEAGDNQNGQCGGSQLISRLHGMLAVDIRETVQHSFGWQSVAAGLLPSYRVTIEVLHTRCLSSVIERPAEVPAGQEPGEHKQAHHALICRRLRPTSLHQQLSLAQVFFRQSRPSKGCRIAAAPHEDRFPEDARAIQPQAHVAG